MGRRLLACWLIALSVVVYVHAQDRGAFLLIGRKTDHTNYPSGLSISGTRIPSASSILTTAGDTWTLGSGSTPTIVILRNGSQAASAFGAQILWYQGGLYVQGDDLQWYLWNGTGFTFFSPSDPESSGCTGSSAAVVPCGYGFGMSTRAAYGCGTDPQILRVTTTSDTGAGSLRQALTTSGPRVVIFEISGYINVTTDMTVTSPCLTVAGQTAPSPGITLRSAATNDGLLVVNTHDVLIQHLRFRPGAATCNSALRAYGGNQTNVVFDHLSVSWGQDENIAISGSNTTTNATIWRSMSTEGLFQAPGSDGCSGGGLANGHGILINTGASNVAVLQSLMALNFERNPYFQSGTAGYVANNVMYNTADGFFMADPDGIHLSSSATVVGNYFKRGPAGSADAFAIGVRYLPVGSQLYVSDNATDNGGLMPAIIPFEVLAGAPMTDPRVGTPPVTLSGYVPLSAADTYAAVLAHVGARPTDRDAVDARVILAVQNRTGQPIQQESDVGGYPALAVNTRALTTPASPHAAAADGSGYTNLEVWLHGYATAVEQ